MNQTSYKHGSYKWMWDKSNTRFPQSHFQYVESMRLVDKSIETGIVLDQKIKDFKPLLYVRAFNLLNEKSIIADFILYDYGCQANNKINVI